MSGCDRDRRWDQRVAPTFPARWWEAAAAGRMRPGPSSARRRPMPLLDHFHPPLSATRKWEGFHSHWTSSLAAQLNAGLLPPGHFAEPQVTHGRIEVDVAADRLGGNGAASGLASASAGGRASATPPDRSPAAPTLRVER